MITEVAKQDLTRELASANFERSFYVTDENNALKVKSNDLGLDIKAGRPNRSAVT
jgi:hypothetical protein